MTVGEMESVSDDALWGGLQEHVRATLGIVGISKMLAAGSEDAARMLWASRARLVLGRIVEHVPVAGVGMSRFVASDGVELRLDIHNAVISIEGVPRISTMILFDPAALMLAVVGCRRWGRGWSVALSASGSPRPVVERDDPGPDLAAFPWVAQNPGHPGPWTVAASAEEAGLAAVAEDLGFERVAVLFDEFRRDERE